MPSVGSFSRVSQFPTLQGQDSSRSVRAPQRLQASPTSTPTAPTTAPTHAIATGRKGSVQDVAQRKTLESKDQITDRIDVGLAKLQKNGIDISVAKNKTSRFVSALKSLGKAFTGLFSKATNLVIGAVKLTFNVAAYAVGVPIAGLISLGKTIAGIKQETANPFSHVQEFIKPVNEGFNTAMKEVTKFFAGEGAVWESGGDEDVSQSADLASDNLNATIHEGLGQGADNLGMNFIGDDGPGIGQVGKQGELAMQMGMGTAIAGGIEGGGTLMDGAESVGEGGDAIIAGKAKLAQAATLKTKIENMQRVYELKQEFTGIEAATSQKGILELQGDLTAISQSLKTNNLQDSVLTDPITVASAKAELARITQNGQVDPILLPVEQESQCERLESFIQLSAQIEFKQLTDDPSSPTHVDPGLDTSKPIEEHVKPLKVEMKRLEAAGQFLQKAGSSQQTQGAIDMIRGTGDMALSANGIINLMAGSDSLKHLISASDATASTVGTATQIIGSGAMVITKGIECGLDIKRAINADANVEKARSFVDSVADQVDTMEDEMVVAAVKQFEKKQAQSGFLSKVKAVLNGALAVAGVAALVATCVLGAMTPVGWAIGGAALLVGIGFALHSAYKSQRESDNISALETTRSQVQDQMQTMLQSDPGIASSVEGKSMDVLDQAVRNAEMNLGTVQIEGEDVEASDLTRDQIESLMNGDPTQETLCKDLLKARDEQSFKILQNASDEIDLALCSISPRHAADTLAEIVFSDPSSQSGLSASAKAKTALREVFKISPHVFQPDPKDPTKPMDSEAFAKGRKMLTEKLGAFYTNVFDDSLLVTVTQTDGSVRSGR